MRHHKCEPDKTLFEPRTPGVPQKRLLDLLLEHYDELQKLIDLTSHDISIDGEDEK